MRTISLISQKGGVGKTTLTINLAVAAAEAGAGVVIADTDPQQSAFNWFEARRAERPAPYVSAVFPEALAAFMETARNASADFLFIDSSPNSTEDSLTIADCADLLVIPCGPSFVDLRALKRTQNVVRLAGKPALAVLNLCPAYGDEPRQAKEALATLGFAVASSHLGARAAARRAYARHLGVLEYEPLGKSAIEFRNLWDEVAAFDASTLAAPACA